jgi:predicted amidohydrolase YtcJ
MATAVAVRDGKILHVGALDELEGHLDGSDYIVDRQFEECTITPGFIEAHGHLFGDGSVCDFPWVGFDDRVRADGTVDHGCTTISAVIDRLRRDVDRALSDGKTLLGFGFDPTFHDGRALNAHDLDQVSTELGVIVMNASGHLCYANSTQMAINDISAASVAPGVMVDAKGNPTGEFHETAMGLVLANSNLLGASPTQATWNGGRLAQLAGCTTMTDIGMVTVGEAFDAFRVAARSEEFPVRVAYSPNMVQMRAMMSLDERLEMARRLRADSTERCFLGPLKWLADGSIQGYTGKLKWPGYCGGEDHGFLILDEEAVVEEVTPFHREGFQAAIHTNGDEATEVVLAALERILVSYPRPDHRHRLEHCQLASPAHFRKMAALGVGVNLFSNHLYYWGDTHRTKTVGPDKARRMNATRSAIDAGVTFSIHSDAPVTPVAPLFTMWCAVNRQTRSGFVLGDYERLTPREALEAVTLGSAKLLHLDHLAGSIEVGKWADFTVLTDSPLEVDERVLNDIGVVGTIVGGRVTERAS